MKNLISTLVIAAKLFSCNVLKNGVSYNGKQSIFAKHYLQYSIEYRKVEYGEPNFELGIEFRPHKNGCIRGIRIKNPQT